MENPGDNGYTSRQAFPYDEPALIDGLEVHRAWV
jgi:hypothetical protein